MRVQENIGKISWSIADKGLYILYGFVLLFQIKALLPEDFGLFTQFNNLHTWIFIISDSFALQSIIQFGAKHENRPKVNLLTLIIHIVIALGSVSTIFIFQDAIGAIVNQPRFNEIAAALPIMAILFIPRTYCIKFIYREHKMHFLFLVNFAWLGTMSALTVYLITIQKNLDFSDMLFISYIGAAASSFIAIILTFRELKFGFKGTISLKKLTNFGTPLVIYNSLHSMPKLLDVYVLQYFFSTSAIGIYSSAKALFRFFEEAINGAHGLVYPAAVRKAEQNNTKELNDLMTKSVSFIFIAFLFVVILLEFGFSKLIIESFLSSSYVNAIGQFNLMALSALALPFAILSSLIVATGKPRVVLKIVFVSLIASLLAFLLTGFIGEEAIVPLGYMVYIFVSGLLYFLYVNRNFDFKVVEILRAIGDSKHFIQNYFKK